MLHIYIKNYMESSNLFITYVYLYFNTLEVKNLII